MITQKIAGQETVTPAPAPEPQGNVIDLMEALKQSVENSKGGMGSEKKTRSRKKTAV